MTNDDIEDFEARMAALCELYDVGISETRTELYWSALSDVTIEEFDAAVRAHVRDRDRGRFFPKPADLVGASGPDFELQAAEGWRLVIENAGRFDRATFSDRIVHAVLRDLGGWARIGRAPERELPFLRRDFVDLYARHAKRGGPPPDTPDTIGYASGYAGSIEPEHERVGWIGPTTERGGLRLVHDARRLPRPDGAA